MMFIRYIMALIRVTRSPLLGALLLIVASMAIGIYISLLSSKWIRYIIILLFLGGIIVLFVYICTLISRLKRFIKNSYDSLLLGVGRGAVMGVFLYSQYWDVSFGGKGVLLTAIYVKSNFLMVLICIVYLLLVLIIRIKISQKFKGGIKSKIYDF